MKIYCRCGNVVSTLPGINAQCQCGRMLSVMMRDGRLQVESRNEASLENKPHCVYFGKPTGDYWLCSRCGHHSGKEPIYECSVNGTCILRKASSRPGGSVWEGGVCSTCNLRDDAPGHAPLWVPTSQLINDVGALIGKIPSGIDAVIGIPRSGMVVASIIAANMHLPLFSIGPNGPFPVGHGMRLSPKESKKSLIVDDTVASGRAIRIAKSLMPTSLTAVVYAPGPKRGLVDFVGRKLDLPHYLEWNFPNSIHSESCGWDLDGVIHGHRGRPLLLPRKYPAKIITGRLEKNRARTEQWLDQHGIKIDFLEMWQGSEEDRDEGHAMAKYKADMCKKHGITLYVESELGLAKLIHRYGVPTVICPPEAKVFFS